MGLFGSGGQLTKKQRQTLGQQAYMKLEENDRSGAFDLLEPHIGKKSRHPNGQFCVILAKHKRNMHALRVSGSDATTIYEGYEVKEQLKKFLIEFVQ